MLGCCMVVLLAGRVCASSWRIVLSGYISILVPLSHSTACTWPQFLKCMFPRFLFWGKCILLCDFSRCVTFTRSQTDFLSGILPGEPDGRRGWKRLPLDCDLLRPGSSGKINSGMRQNVFHEINQDLTCNWMLEGGCGGGTLVSIVGDGRMVSTC